MLSKVSFTRGSGCESLIAAAVRRQKSTQKQCVSSFFLTSTTDADHGLLDPSITLCSNSFDTSCCKSTWVPEDALQGCSLIGKWKVEVSKSECVGWQNAHILQRFWFAGQSWEKLQTPRLSVQQHSIQRTPDTELSCIHQLASLLQLQLTTNELHTMF